MGMPPSNVRRSRAAGVLFVTLLAVAGVHAVTIDDGPPRAKIIQSGPVNVFRVGEETYTLAAVPDEATDVEFYSSPDQVPDKYRDAASKLSMGLPIARDEVLTVLTAWYNETAFDADSIKIRGLQVGDQTVVVWCSLRLFALCTDHELRAGTRLRFEVNGKNRSGGMTGFQAQLMMLRHVPGKAAAVSMPVAPASAPTAAQ